MAAEEDRRRHQLRREAEEEMGVRMRRRKAIAAVAGWGFLLERFKQCDEQYFVSEIEIEEAVAAA